MKKHLALTLTVAMLLSMSLCAAKPAEETTADMTSETTEAEVIH